MGKKESGGVVVRVKPLLLGNPKSTKLAGDFLGLSRAEQEDFLLAVCFKSKDDAISVRMRLLYEQKKKSLFDHKGKTNPRVTARRQLVWQLRDEDGLTVSEIFRQYLNQIEELNGKPVGFYTVEDDYKLNRKNR